MKTMLLGATCAAALTASLVASREARAWGLHDGEGIGVQDNLVYAEGGFPGVSVGYARGLNDRIEVGGRLDLIYGLESTPQNNIFINSFGFGLVGTLRYTLRRDDKLSLEVHAYPGIKFDSFKPVLFGLQIPVGIEGGHKVARDLFVTGGLDFSIYGEMSKGGYFAFAPTAGPGVEYHLSEHITIGGITRFGAAVRSGDNYFGGTYFAFRTQAYFGYRL